MNNQPPNPLPETLPAGTRFSCNFEYGYLELVEPARAGHAYGCWIGRARAVPGGYVASGFGIWPAIVDWSTYRPEPASEPTTKPGPERRFCACGQEVWLVNGSFVRGSDGAPMCSDCFSNERARALHGVMVEPIDARIRAAQPADEPVCAWATATDEGVEWR